MGLGLLNDEIWRRMEGTPPDVRQSFQRKSSLLILADNQGDHAYTSKGPIGYPGQLAWTSTIVRPAYTLTNALYNTDIGGQFIRKYDNEDHIWDGCQENWGSLSVCCRRGFPITLRGSIAWCFPSEFIPRLFVLLLVAVTPLTYIL